jgi:uncharacterized Tic20 family protein
MLDKPPASRHYRRMDAQLPPLPPGPNLSSDDKIWAIACHLSLLLGVGFLLPLIVWLAKRGDSPVTAAHAREALNFHLSLYLYGLCCIPLIFLFCLGYALIPVIALFGLVCAIMAAVEASKGGFYHYPLAIPFFR